MNRDNNDWKQNFQASATSVAFQMSLSKNMVAVLAAVAVDRTFDLHSIFVPAARALQRRGLITHHLWNKDTDGPFHKLKWHRLTPAGEHVLALCRLAGLLPGTQEADDAAEA